MLKIPDPVYDVLKWLTLVCIPAFTTAYVGLAAIWGWPYADEVAESALLHITRKNNLLMISGHDPSAAILFPAACSPARPVLFCVFSAGRVQGELF